MVIPAGGARPRPAAPALNGVTPKAKTAEMAVSPVAHGVSAKVHVSARGALPSLRGCCGPRSPPAVHSLRRLGRGQLEIKGEIPRRLMPLADDPAGQFARWLDLSGQVFHLEVLGRFAGPLNPHKQRLGVVRRQSLPLHGPRRCRGGTAARTEHDQYQRSLLAVLGPIDATGGLEIPRFLGRDGVFIE